MLETRDCGKESKKVKEITRVGSDRWGHPGILYIYLQGRDDLITKYPSVD